MFYVWEDRFSWLFFLRLYVHNLFDLSRWHRWLNSDSLRLDETRITRRINIWPTCWPQPIHIVTDVEYRVRQQPKKCMSLFVNGLTGSSTQQLPFHQTYLIENTTYYYWFYLQQVISIHVCTTCFIVCLYISVYGRVYSGYYRRIHRRKVIYII